MIRKKSTGGSGGKHKKPANAPNPRTKPSQGTPNNTPKKPRRSIKEWLDDKKNRP